MYDSMIYSQVWAGWDFYISVYILSLGSILHPFHSDCLLVDLKLFIVIHIYIEELVCEA